MQASLEAESKGKAEAMKIKKKLEQDIQYLWMNVCYFQFVFHLNWISDLNLPGVFKFFIFLV
jgi:hypothetical protein